MATEVEPGRLVEIDYTNYRGERRKRVIEPRSIRFGANDYHTERQWLLDAYDVEKGEGRTFAMVDIHGWQRIVAMKGGDQQDDVGLSVGALREAIVSATELNGAYGENMHESKKVAIRVDGVYHRLEQVSVGFLDGKFVLILQGVPWRYEVS